MKLLKTGFVKTLAVFNRFFVSYSRLTDKLFPGAAATWHDMHGSMIDSKKTDIVHKLKGKDIEFSFYTPNSLSRYRAETFSTKEPETLEWIDKNAPDGGVFFDIGANVGLYSIYHAKTKQGVTYSFEPSVFNLKLLVKNININNCQDKIKIVSNPLTSANSFADFNLQSIVEGGALSSFGVDYGQDGNKLNTQVSYQTLGFSLDYLVENKIIEHVPSTIKIDVDGIEHLILKGAKKVLSNPICRSVLIEVNESCVEWFSTIGTILKDAGFTPLEKPVPENLNADSAFTYNQIWIKE